MKSNLSASDLVEHLFRQHAGGMLATLTRLLGLRNLALAEEVVQEALITALQQWPYQGAPDNPSAWLIQVAKNRALDRLRRDRAFAERERDVVAAFETRASGALAASATGPDVIRPFEDDELCMMFMACHPEIPRESRVALTLKTVGGFSVTEIARAFLAQESAIAQRLVRVKKLVRERDIPLDLPGDREMPERLDSVLEVLYLMFNEGYAAHAGDSLVRHDPTLSRYYLFHATMGELSREAGNLAEAARYYGAALELPCSEPARRFLERKLAASQR